VSHNSTKAEYKVVVDATAELIWVQSLLRELGISQDRGSVVPDATVVVATLVVHGLEHTGDARFRAAEKSVSPGAPAMSEEVRQWGWAVRGVE
jgi:hypothetical protein